VADFAARKANLLSPLYRIDARKAEFRAFFGDALS
jgi:hypothetical protein